MPEFNKNVLVISGHPDHSQSVATSSILESLSQHPWISIRKLETLYPDYQFDIAAEQAALLEADIVVLQYPLFWSSFPAILKKWIDDVFTFGFAFGDEGDKLKEKTFILSITAGATEESYSETGFNYQPLDNYMDATFHALKAAQVDLRDYLVTYSMNSNPNEGGDHQYTERLAQQHTEQLISRIKEEN